MKKIVSIVIFAVMPALVLAQETSKSHCLPEEKLILNANMGRGIDDSFKPNGKVLSLCADNSKEPMNRVVYRYGKIGAVELEQIATPQAKLNVDSGYVPKTPISIFWFQKGNLIYAIKEFSGMANLIKLEVYSGKNIISELYAREFDSNIFSIDFSRPKSPALIFREYPFPKDI